MARPLSGLKIHLGYTSDFQVPCTSDLHDVRSIMPYRLDYPIEAIKVLHNNPHRFITRLESLSYV